MEDKQLQQWLGVSAWMGTIPSNILSSATFKPTDPDDDFEQGMSHKYQLSVLWASPIPDEAAAYREKVIQTNLNLHEEIIAKLLVQAINIAPGIKIDEDAMPRILDALREFLNGILSGSPLFLPYLQPITAVGEKNEVTKGVQLMLYLWISKRQRSGGRQLYWNVVAGAWNRQTAADGIKILAVKNYDKDPD